MAEEAQESVDLQERQWKNMLLSNNPDLYKAFYPEEFSTPRNAAEDPDVEEVVPETEADFSKMMFEMRQLGLVQD